MDSGRRYGEEQIENARLESFANRTRHRDYEIAFTCPEFTCLCPLSGFPDFAMLQFRYVPDERCVELKSLKLYINHYRTEYVFHEDVVNRILDDFITEVDPKWVELTGDFSVRGNIKTVITARHQKNGFEWPRWVSGVGYRGSDARNRLSLEVEGTGDRE